MTDPIGCTCGEESPPCHKEECPLADCPPEFTSRNCFGSVDDVVQWLPIDDDTPANQALILGWRDWRA